MIARKLKTRVAAWALAWSGVFVAAGMGGAGRAADWQSTLAAARKEGRVVVSLPPNAELRMRTEQAFEKRFTGIDMEPFPGRGSKNVRRIADERRSGVHYFDVHVGGTMSMLYGLVRPGMADPIKRAMVLPEVRDPANWWGGHIYVDKAKMFAYSFAAYLTQNIYYNTELVDPRQVGTYDDLLDPVWKGRIGFYDPRTPGPGDSTWTYLWEVKGEDYLRRLVGQDLLVTRDLRVLGESLAKGKLAMTIGVSYYTLAPFLKAGLPIQVLPIPREGTYPTGGTGAMVVLRNHPHPNATSIFVNWLLGSEGQEVFTRAVLQASRRLDVDSRWTRRLGFVGAKEALSVEDYYRYENQSEERIEAVRIPARRFARRILK